MFGLSLYTTESATSSGVKPAFYNLINVLACILTIHSSTSGRSGLSYYEIAFAILSSLSQTREIRSSLPKGFQSATVSSSSSISLPSSSTGFLRFALKSRYHLEYTTPSVGV